MRYFIYCRKSSEAEDRQVLSIESQLTTLQRTFGASADIEIAHVFEESFSAKAPGRQLFGEMMKRIERGDAEGIIAWAPDRLARNSIDGGQIVYLLDRGVLKDLKFATYTFENNPQGKFMLQIMFGQSKYYSDALSENVKRGNRTKLERGWRPSHAPLGYLNDKATRTIVRDPVHFPLVRSIYDLMLTGAYSPRQIAVIARDEWGFRTPTTRKTGGRPLAMCTVYRILTNPFYAGIIKWRDETYIGKHEPLCTLDEQDRIRKILARPGVPRPKKEPFAFTKLIRCGSCGLGITAERKTNKYGSRYVYYHCTKSRMPPRCKEPYVDEGTLERQVLDFLNRVSIPEPVAAVLETKVVVQASHEREHQEAKLAALNRAIASVERQQSELIDIRIRGLINDAECMSRRDALKVEHHGLVQRRDDLARGNSRIELFKAFISFRKSAADWYLHADNPTKRLILEIAASNFSLTGKKLSIEARKPFVTGGDFGTLVPVRALVEDIRTFFDTDVDAQVVGEQLLTLCQQFSSLTLSDDEASRSTSPKSPSPRDHSQPSCQSLLKESSPHQI